LQGGVHTPWGSPVLIAAQPGANYYPLLPIAMSPLASAVLLALTRTPNCKAIQRCNNCRELGYFYRECPKPPAADPG